MKVAFVFVVAGICAVALATTGFQEDKFHKVADKVFLQKQKDILRLFKYVNQQSYYKDHVEIADTWKMEDHMDCFTKPEVAKIFWQNYQHGMLPKGQIFSVFYDEHLDEAIALFKMFYYAKDYETFYKTAVWARQHVNEGMFVYSLSVAVVHREDTYGIVLPPIYEIYPYYFFNSEVIEKVHQYKQMFQEKQTTGDFKGYMINANYSGWYMNLHPEQYLGYFTEDLGMNAYYYYFNLYYPFWMENSEFHFKNERRGEQYYYVYQQLLARYYLERLSSDFGPIEQFDWDYPIETGYYPSMHYPNGLEFPVRPSNVHLYKKHSNGWQSIHNMNHTGSYTLTKDQERRMRDAIDLGYVYTHDGKKINIYEPKGFEILGNLIEGNQNSPNSRFYGAIQIFARHYLGYSNYPLDDYKIAPSALEHFETSMRDPAFFQFYKKLVMYFVKYQNYLPHYEYSELNFPGVKIENVEMDKLMTFFDYFETDITNAAYVNQHEFETEPFQVHARQYRLNSKPFNYKITVNSEKATQGVVKVFIGPKHDEYGRDIDINENRLNFVEFDTFIYNFQAGKNIVERNSEDNHYVKDRTTYKQLYQHVLSALEGKEEFIMNGEESFYGMPNRFALPRGIKSGMKYQFYVMVAPYKTEPPKDTFYPVATGYHSYEDSYPLGYPFNRYIKECSFFVPNSYMKDILIYHQTEGDINETFKLVGY